MRSKLEALGEHLQWTVASQVEVIFSRLDDFEVGSRLVMLEWKVDVFTEELDDLIEERVAILLRVYRGAAKAKENSEAEIARWSERDDGHIPYRYSYLRRRYMDGCDVKTWEKFKRELKRQFYLESAKSMVMINLQRLRQKGSIMRQWVATELRRREPQDLDFTMAIVERFKDFKQGERPKSPGHEHAKDGGDGKSKSGSPKATDDEWNGDERHHRHQKGEKKHEGSHKARKTQEVLVDTGAIHNIMSSRVTEWLGLKLTKDESWFTTVNTEERPTKGVIKNVDLRIGGCTEKADFNIIDMGELGVVLRMDFMEKSSPMLNPYRGVMMMVGEEGQPKWMIPLVSTDGADACKVITVLQLDKGSTLCYGEQ
ncbi:hypothetical protein RJ639_044358 [Escallonia herrerae]|uniref:Retrotransposon gag domain-containing protein n=1 Tax=Escallonia herrerae TaxID=1293975 RepID=A0AA88WE24_9ASTE|nr:hypothetical protein RJ639_044358 [Escallonia herrerae]